MAKLRTITASKEWVTLEEAVRELVYVLKEDVSEDDLWLLAYEKKLVFSIYIRESYIDCIRYFEFDIFNKKSMALYGHIEMACNAASVSGEFFDVDSSIKNFQSVPESQYDTLSDVGNYFFNRSVEDGFVNEEVSFIFYYANIDSPEIVDGFIYRNFWLNRGGYGIAALGVYDILPIELFQEELIRRVDNKFENSSYGCDNISKKSLMAFRNYEYFDLNKNKKAKSVEDVGPIVVKTKNLQSYLDEFFPDAGLRSRYDEQVSSGGAWMLNKPRNENEVNMAIYYALLQAQKDGLKNPKDINMLILLINSQGMLGQCMKKGSYLYFHAEKPDSFKISRSLKSIKQTIDIMVRA